jgi:hypothetical protein
MKNSDYVAALLEASNLFADAGLHATQLFRGVGTEYEDFFLHSPC